jgi:membrane fusion protein, multidrug efflux system
MKFRRRATLVAFAIAFMAVAGHRIYGARTPKAKGPDSSSAVSSPVASVKVAPIKKETISSIITAYGDVVPAPGAVQVVSMPYETRVSRIMVSSGQKISQDDELLELEPSPDTLLKLDQAKNAYEISRQKLDHMKQLFSLKLATNAQILGARESFRRASLQLESLKKRGVGGNKVIRARVSGLISRIQVKEGAIVPAGHPLMEIVAQDRLEVRLGVEPGDAARLSPGQAVSLYSVNEPSQKRVAGRIRKVSQAVDRATRLVDVFVALPGPGGFLLGEYVTGRIQTASSYGMAVPRSAVLPENGKYVLYTVRNGRAFKHMVKVGVESRNRVQVSGGGLKPGDVAVVLGNYALKDGMAVKVEKTQ